MSKKRNLLGCDFQDPKVQWKWLLPYLRKASRYWPPKIEAKRKSRISGGVHLCASCQKAKHSIDINMDHIRPVGGLGKGETIAEPFMRLFCLVEGWQALCEKCHKEKTSKERLKRRVAASLLKLGGKVSPSKAKPVKKKRPSVRGNMMKTLLDEIRNDKSHV